MRRITHGVGYLILILGLLSFRTSIAHALGACCPPPCYECYVVSEEECEELGGGWNGEGTTCDPAP